MTELLQRMLEMPNPFIDATVHDAEQPLSHDVESIHRELTDWVVRTAGQAMDADARKILVLNGESGIGKTHMLARIYRESVERGFICISIGGWTGQVSVADHILYEIIRSLMRPRPGERWSRFTELQISQVQQALADRPAGELIGRHDGARQHLGEFLEDHRNHLEIGRRTAGLESLSDQVEEYLLDTYPAGHAPFFRAIAQSIRGPRSGGYLSLKGEYDRDLFPMDGELAIGELAALIDQPILVAFDQLENWDEAGDGENPLKKLSNVLQNLCRHRGMTFLLMAQAASWSRMLEVSDVAFQNRIGRNVKSIGNLKPEELLEMVARRLEDFHRGRTDRPIAPFDVNKLTEVASKLGHNPRSFLNHLSDTWDRMVEKKKSEIEGRRKTRHLDPDQRLREEFVIQEARLRRDRTDPQKKFELASTYLGKLFKMIEKAEIEHDHQIRKAQLQISVKGTPGPSVLEVSTDRGSARIAWRSSTGNQKSLSRAMRSLASKSPKGAAQILIVPTRKWPAPDSWKDVQTDLIQMMKRGARVIPLNRRQIRELLTFRKVEELVRDRGLFAQEEPVTAEQLESFVARTFPLTSAYRDFMKAAGMKVKVPAQGDGLVPDATGIVLRQIPTGADLRKCVDPCDGALEILPDGAVHCGRWDGLVTIGRVARSEISAGKSEYDFCKYWVRKALEWDLS